MCDMGPTSHPSPCNPKRGSEKTFRRKKEVYVVARTCILAYFHNLFIQFPIKKAKNQYDFFSFSYCFKICFCFVLIICGNPRRGELGGILQYRNRWHPFGQNSGNSPL